MRRLVLEIMQSLEAEMFQLWGESSFWNGTLQCAARADLAARLDQLATRDVRTLVQTPAPANLANEELGDRVQNDDLFGKKLLRVRNTDAAARDIAGQYGALNG